jgi:hypothetical protein
MTTREKQKRSAQQMRNFIRTEQRELRAGGRVTRDRLKAHHEVIENKWGHFAKKADMTIEELKTLYIKNF